MQGSALDEMVNLQHADRIALPIQEHQGLRRIVYSVVEDIPALLQSGFELPSSISDGPEHTLELNEGSEDDIADHIDDHVYEDPTEHDAYPYVVIEDISQDVALIPSAASEKCFLAVIWSYLCGFCRWVRANCRL